MLQEHNGSYRKGKECNDVFGEDILGNVYYNELEEYYIEVYTYKVNEREDKLALKTRVYKNDTHCGDEIHTLEELYKNPKWTPVEGDSEYLPTTDEPLVYEQKV